MRDDGGRDGGRDGDDSDRRVNERTKTNWTARLHVVSGLQMD